MSAIARSSGFVESDGERIYYETAGEGETILFCHGLGGNHAIWYQQVQCFAPSFHIVTWDQRGFGMSSNIEGDSGPPAAVRDIGALLDHLSVERAHLVGQSMGGWAIMGFALQSPQRVASMVICDSPAGVMNAAIAEIFAKRVRPPAGHDVVGASAAIGDALRASDPTKAFLYQQIGSFRTSVDETAMLARLYGTVYPLEEVHRLRMPVLLIVGSDDPLVPPEVMRQVSAELGGAALVEIDGAGHSPYFEQPAVWNDAVLPFLGSG